jgi:hypothetical protein
VAERPTPRAVPLLFGLVFVVLGVGALASEAGLVTIDAVALVAVALLAGGAAALVLPLAALRRA